MFAAITNTSESRMKCILLLPVNIVTLVVTGSHGYDRIVALLGLTRREYIEVSREIVSLQFSFPLLLSLI